MKSTLKIFGMLLMSLVLVTSCGKDDPEPKPNPEGGIKLEKTEVTLQVSEQVNIKITPKSDSYTFEQDNDNVKVWLGEDEVRIRGVKEGSTKVEVIDALTNKKGTINVTVEANGGGSTEVQKITFTTNRAVGETLYNIEIVPLGGDDNLPNLWIDLNNNGTKEEGEDVKKGSRDYVVESQTISVYGDVSNFIIASTDIEYLDKKITSITVENGHAIEHIECRENQSLTSVSLGECPNLELFSCISCNLSSLDVSKCPKLGKLWCEKNNLNALDVSNNTELYQFTCFKNPLTAIDVRNNTKLVDFNCHLTQISSLDVSNVKKLRYFNCKENPNLTCIKVSDFQMNNNEFGISANTWYKDDTANYSTNCN